MASFWDNLRTVFLPSIFWLLPSWQDVTSQSFQKQTKEQNILASIWMSPVNQIYLLAKSVKKKTQLGFLKVIKKVF